MRGAAPFIAIALLAILAYAPALGHAPVWDDRIYILDYPAVEEARWAEILTRPTGSYHRPVVFTTFAVERAWLRTGPAGMRLTNVALHAGAACLLLLAALRLGAPRPAALAGALLFALHPVQTEAVTYISGRTDLLAALFSLLALLLHARWRGWRGAPPGPGAGGPGALAGALVCYLLALGSKESAAALPLALLAGDLIFLDRVALRRKPGRLLAGIGPYVLLLALYASWRLGLPGTPVTADILAGLPARLPAALAALGDYARLLVFPTNLHLERFVSAAGAGGAMALGALMLAAAVWLFLRGSAAARFWVAWAAAAYLPLANLVPVYPHLPAGLVFAPEHFLYGPSAGLLAATALAAGARLRGKRAVALLTALLACFLLITQARNRDWRDEETLFRHTLRFSPGSARVALNLGNLHFARGDASGAYDLWRDALRRNPDDTDLLTNAGLALLQLGRAPESERLLGRVTALTPADAQAWANLGAAHGTAGRLDEARRAYGRALALDPRNADARAGSALLDRLGKGDPP